MSLHIFASIMTHYGVAANNRGDSQGSNISPLQKLLWKGDTHTTVSAEAIRFAFRRCLAEIEPNGTNRTWNETAHPKPRNEWRDEKFSGWSDPGGAVYIDDDLLGFMSAQAAKEDGSDSDLDTSDDPGKKKRKGKGTVTLRRGVLEIARAISIDPWKGGIQIFNAASPGANLGSKDRDNPNIYGTEVHATRYQYGIALTPDRLRNKSRASKAIEAICSLGTVAGNNGRFLFDFAPDTIVIRMTNDPAPRLLYCFDTPDNGKTLGARSLIQRIDAEDILPKELILGTGELDSELVAQLKKLGVPAFGVKRACEEVVRRINAELNVKD